MDLFKYLIILIGGHMQDYQLSKRVFVGTVCAQHNSHMLKNTCKSVVRVVDNIQQACCVKDGQHMFLLLFESSALAFFST